MDVFFEQIVTRKKTGIIMMKSVGALVGGILVALILLILSPLLGSFSIVGIAAAFGAAYGGYYLSSMQNVEYEYIITNGELDIDRIIARRKRKRILTTQIKTWERFGTYEPAKHAGSNYDCNVVACEDEADDNNYYAVFSHNKLGKTLLVFCPNEKLLENAKKYVSRIAMSADSRAAVSPE